MLRLTRCLLLCFPALASGPNAFAAGSCRLVTAEAQLCQSGTAAAIASRRQKETHGATPAEATAIATLLQRSGCRLAGAAALALPVEAIAGGPVALGQDQIEVVSIRLDHDAYWYVAADSLTPRCEVAGSPTHDTPSTK